MTSANEPNHPAAFDNQTDGVRDAICLNYPDPSIATPRPKLTAVGRLYVLALSTLIGVAVSVPLHVLGVFVGIFAQRYMWATYSLVAIFPFAMFSGRLNYPFHLGAEALICSSIQFPLYGLLIGAAWRTPYLKLTLIGLLAAHLVGFALCFVWPGSF
jgi:hypothetical protein